MTQLTDKRREDDVSNSKMLRFITSEMIIWLAVTIFLFGASYMTFAAEQKTAKEERVDTKTKIEKMDLQQESIKATVASIQLDTAVIRNDQEHMSKTLERNTKSIEKVLEILMKYDNGSNIP